MAHPAVAHERFLVLDASVAVKLVLPEPHSEEARELVFGNEFARHFIIAPLIVMTDVAAAIAKAVPHALDFAPRRARRVHQLERDNSEHLRRSDPPRQS